MRAILILKLKRMSKDISLYAIMIIMAILLTFIFSKAMAGGGAKRVCVVDLDNTSYSAVFLEQLSMQPYLLERTSKKEGEKQVVRGGAVAMIIIEKGLADGQKISLIYGSDSVEVGSIKNATEQAWAHTANLYFLSSYLNENGIELGIKEIQAKRSSLDKLVGTILTIKNAPSYDSNMESNFHFLMGFNIFFVTFSIIFTIGSILEDKQLKTWQRIRLSPIRATKILLANFLPSFAVGIAQMAIVLLVGQYLMGIKLANIGVTFLSFSAYAFTVTCLGLFLCAILKNYNELNALTPIITVSTSMLGGCMWPLSIISSPVMLLAADFTPQRWAMQGAMQGAMVGGGLADIAKSLIILISMAIALFGVSVAVLLRESRGGKA